MVTSRKRNNTVVNKRSIKFNNAKQGRSNRGLIIVILVIAIILMSFFLPIFNIQYVNVTGNNVLSPNTIIEVSGIELGKNVFSVNLRNSRERITSMPYIDSVKIWRSMPNKINVKVVERAPIGYILFMGSYILIDREGYVLEVSSNVQELKVPLLSGMKFNKFRIGEKIEVENKEKLDIIFSCVKEILRNDLIGDISEIDIDDKSNIRFVVNKNIVVNVGNNTELNYKTSFLKEILHEINDGDTGFIDLSSGKPVFKPASN